MDVKGLLILSLIATATVVIARQVRRPTWWPGQLTARSMNWRHLAVTSWGLQHVAFEPGFTILDVGCGGGRTIQQLSTLAPSGHVYGVDYAAASVAVATKVNAAAIAAGRVDIVCGSVSNLPFAPDMFDVVTAVETHYYWPDLIENLKEVRRVLKPGGRLAIIAESYRGKRFGAAETLAMGILGGTLLTTGAHRDALVGAGYSDVEILEERRRGWVCAVGRKSS
jgi:SAM-dependent methyltransferase